MYCSYPATYPGASRVYTWYTLTRPCKDTREFICDYSIYGAVETGVVLPSTRNVSASRYSNRTRERHSSTTRDHRSGRSSNATSLTLGFGNSCGQVSATLIPSLTTAQLPSQWILVCCLASSNSIAFGSWAPTYLHYLQYLQYLQYATHDGSERGHSR